MQNFSAKYKKSKKPTLWIAKTQPIPKIYGYNKWKQNKTHILGSAPAARQSNTIDERKKPIRTDTRTHTDTLRKMVFLSSLILTNFQTTQQEIPKLDGSSENKKKVHEKITKKNVKKSSGYEFYES